MSKSGKSMVSLCVGRKVQRHTIFLHSQEILNQKIDPNNKDKFEICMYITSLSEYPILGLFRNRLKERIQRL